MSLIEPISRVNIRPAVLIVEDDVMIGMALEDILGEAGFRVIGPALSVMMATTLLRVEHPDVAVLDYNLKNETVIPVARSLTALGIPFVLSSGCDASEVADPVFDHILNVGKPPQPAKLVQALDELLT